MSSSKPGGSEWRVPQGGVEAVKETEPAWFQNPTLVQPRGRAVPPQLILASDSSGYKAEEAERRRYRLIHSSFLCLFDLISVQCCFSSWWEGAHCKQSFSTWWCLCRSPLPLSVSFKPAKALISLPGSHAQYLVGSLTLNWMAQATCISYRHIRLCALLCHLGTDLVP